MLRGRCATLRFRFRNFAFIVAFQIFSFILSGGEIASNLNKETFDSVVDLLTLLLYSCKLWHICHWKHYYSSCMDFQVPQHFSIWLVREWVSEWGRISRPVLLLVDTFLWVKITLMNRLTGGFSRWGKPSTAQLAGRNLCTLIAEHCLSLVDTLFFFYNGSVQSCQI